MTPERWEKVRDVLGQVLEMVPEKRPQFLNEACADDASLRSEVESLLSSDESARSSFLQSPPVPPTALTKGTRLGDYEIVSLVGSGGMGEVYRARDTKLKRDVAIKVLPAYWSRDPERLERFELEARAAASLNHPNITSVFHVGQHDGSPYIVTELLHGEALRDRLRKGPIRLHEALDYGAEIARGLGAAHDAGVIHRDLKPENIFVTKDGRIKILDFGLAKLQVPKSAKPEDPTVFPRQTNPGQVLGTVGYMSPEQVRGQHTDARSDIFAAGAVLYEMLTGKPAFRKATSAETMSAILNEDPPTISQLAPNLPPGLQRIVNRCLAKNPEQRFQHASDVAFALEALSDSSAASPMIPGATARSDSAMGSRVIWLAGAVLAAGLSLASGWWHWNHTPNEPREIQQRQLTARTSDNPIFSSVISRDGKYLAYSDKDGVSIQDIASGETHKLPGTANLNVIDWHPDGLRLLAVDNKHDLLTLFAVTGEKHKVASNVDWASLSPDGSEIIFVTGNTPNELLTMPTSGGEAKVRFAIGKREGFLAAAWSPDGKAVADVRVAMKPDSPGVLETRNLENGESRGLLTDVNLVGRGVNNVSWLPGGRIVFALYKGSPTESDLWGLALDSSGSAAGKPFRLSNTTGLRIDGLSANSDGKRLAILFSRGSYSLFIANLSRNADKLEQPLRLTHNYWNSHPGCWTSDSQTLFYNVDRNDQGQRKSSIYERQISSDSAELFLTGSESYVAWSLSPDGAWVIATANRRIPGKGRLLRVPLSGGAPETILDLAGVGEAQCTNTGSGFCVFSEVIGKQVVFTAFDPLRGRKEELVRIDTPDSDPHWSLSPDGHLIALVETNRDRDHVRALDLQNKRMQIIHPLDRENDLETPAWSANGKKLFLSGIGITGGVLLEVDFSGQTHLLLTHPWDWIGSPSPSPDGKRIAYSYAIGESNVTLFEHF